MTSDPAARGWKQRFPALTYPDYRLWLIARFGWSLGYGMGQTSVAFLAYELTRSAAFLGSVSFSFGIPILLFTMYGGVLADRLDRRKLVVTMQLFWLVPSGTVAVLAFLHLVQPWHLVAFGLMTGAIHAFDGPARSSFMPDLVSREDLANASMINSLAYYGIQALAPGIGGLIYALFGPAWCLLLSAAAFVPAAICYSAIRTGGAPRTRPSTSAARQMWEGLSYALHHSTERTLLLLIGLTTMFGLAGTVLVPAWAVKIMHGDAATNGLLLSAVGIGTVVSAAAIALLGRFSYKGKLLTIATFVAPVMWLVFTQVRWLPLSVVVLIGVGATSFPILTLSMVLLQLLVPDHLRGRLMGITNLTNVGMQSLGGLLIGVLARSFGEPSALVFAALVLLSAAISIFALYPKLRTLE